MKCLSSAQIQAVADGEAAPAEREHAKTCAGCARAVGELKARISQLTADSEAVEMPADVARRIDSVLAGTSGATRLRPEPRRRAWLAPAWGAVAVAAATLVAVVFVAPMLKEDRGAVSASEILAASATRLSERVSEGVEILEYQLVLDGVPRDVMPEHENGTYRVRQVIDHTVPGRFRFSSFAPDGRPVSSIAQDPSTGRRVMMFVHEGQAYRFDMTVPSDVGPSIVEMERLHMQATIAMMQGSGGQELAIVETPAGRQYRIEVPKVETPMTNPVWDLSEARVLIDATDYRVTEFAVKGTFLERPYSIDYRLISRSVVQTAPAGTFDVPSVAGEIVMSGTGSVIPARDAMVLALRELARLKQGHE